jgi:hypothetical protein
MARQPAQTISAKDIRQYLPVTDLHFHGVLGGFHCYGIPQQLGLRPDSYDPARAFLEELVAYFTSRLSCNHESFVHLGPGRDRSTAHLFADHARNWIPEMGLGVWPHRPPPRQWKAEDLEEMDPAAGMPALLLSLYRVTADANVRLNAMATMLGTGCGVQLISRTDSAALLRDLKELFLSIIHDRVFRIFPWYVPLLEQAALAEPQHPITLRAMQNISLYIRESPEDQGILIVSSEPLNEIIEQLGLELVERGSIKSRWKLGD